MTNLELIREVRKPGKVYMTCLASADDVIRMPVEKAYLLDHLRDLPPNDQASLDIFGQTDDGIILDIA